MAFSTKDIKKKMMYVLGGTVLTEDFFVKNTRFIITLFIIIVLHISNRYSCIEKVATIEKLQRELKDEKYQSLTISANLISVSRGTRVRDLVEKHGLPLEEPKTPTYLIRD